MQHKKNRIITFTIIQLRNYKMKTTGTQKVIQQICVTQ